MAYIQEQITMLHRIDKWKEKFGLAGEKKKGVHTHIHEVLQPHSP